MLTQPYFGFNGSHDTLIWNLAWNTRIWSKFIIATFTVIRAKEQEKNIMHTTLVRQQHCACVCVCVRARNALFCVGVELLFFYFSFLFLLPLCSLISLDMNKRNVLWLIPSFINNSHVYILWLYRVYCAIFVIKFLFTNMRSPFQTVVCVCVPIRIKFL